MAAPMGSNPVPSAPMTMDDNKPNKAGVNQTKRWRCGDPAEYICKFPKNEGDPLENMYKRMKGYDEDMCHAWRDEIEKLLIFASLFSATVTAFTINSYRLLQPDYMQISATLLAQVSLQLAAISNNSTSSAATLPPAPFVQTAQSIRINVFWFMSLIMSLSTVILGILCLQWLREFTRDRPLPPEEAVPIRQICSDGLFAWKVPQMIAYLPVILQASVLLFFAGVLDLLWGLNHVVAIIITVLIGLTVIIITGTVVAPIIQMIHSRADLIWCPYKSPISLLAISFGILVKYSLFWWLIPVGNARAARLKLSSIPTSWAELEMRYRYDYHVKYCKGNEPGGKTYDIQGFVRALEWTVEKLRPRLNHEVAVDVFHSLYSALPTATSRKIMQEWSKRMKRDDEAIPVALGPAAQDHDLQYDLLMTDFLRKCVPTTNAQRQLLLELQLRCLNTANRIGESDVWWKGIPLEALDGKDPEILFQALETILHYNDAQYRDGEILFAVLKSSLRCVKANKNNPCLDNDRQRSIGRALGRCIRYTPVENNIKNCEILLIQLMSLLRDMPIGNQSNDEYQIKFFAFLLHDIDLRGVERWENAIRSTVPVISELVPFIEKTFLPNYEKLELKPQVVPSRVFHGQLRAFHEWKTHSYSMYEPVKARHRSPEHN